jgi:superoxide reductase
MKAKFYICEHCGNLIGMVNDAGVPVVCCGQKMTALVPNTVEASGEKHLPVVKIEGNTLTVNVGSVDHPMIPEHLIQWIYVETENGGMRRALKAGDAPNVTFCLGDEKPVAVYAYCNLHGLWMTEV